MPEKNNDAHSEQELWEAIQAIKKSAEVLEARLLSKDEQAWVQKETKDSDTRAKMKYSIAQSTITGLVWACVVAVGYGLLELAKLKLGIKE